MFERFSDLPDYCDSDSPLYLPLKSEGVYSALDSINTHANFTVMHRCLDATDLATYERDLRHTEAAIVMGERGILIDQVARKEIIQYYCAAERKLKKLFCIFAEALTGIEYPINKLPSPQQVSEILYDKLGVPPEYTLDATTREMRPTTNREAIENLEKKQPNLRPFLRTIKDMRDVSKKRSAVESGVSRDGRMRCVYGTAVLETGRWNSRPYVMYNEGVSMHTLTKEIRRIFIPDPGFVLLYVDLKSAESFYVALESGDENYMRACKSGDIHTYVATMLWPDLPWPAGDRTSPEIIKLCRPISDEKYYRHFSRREICKRNGHLTNYYGKPRTASAVLRLPLHICEEFTELYLHKAFTGIHDWHERLRTLRDTAPVVQLTTAFGRRRTFHGRRDDAMLREMIANNPQSGVADSAARGIYQVFKDLDPQCPPDPNLKAVWCLAHVHDAGLYQVPERYVDELLPEIVERMQVTIPLYNFAIPADYEIGWNWAPVDHKHQLFLDGNPGGMARPGESRPPRIGGPLYNLLGV